MNVQEALILSNHDFKFVGNCVDNSSGSNRSVASIRVEFARAEEGGVFP